MAAAGNVVSRAPGFLLQTCCGKIVRVQVFAAL
jgi:hypothetical protein